MGDEKDKETMPAGKQGSDGDERANGASSGEREETIKDLDAELADLMSDAGDGGSGNGEGRGKDKPGDEGSGKDEGFLSKLESDLEDIERSLEAPREQVDTARFSALVKEASGLSYSYELDDISRTIELYEEAFKIKEGSAFDYYNLGQAYLKRAQKVAGIFTYSFEGHYKDVSDFYKALEATKKAVELAPDDKVYWQTLANIYELMDKKPLLLYCIKKALELYREEEKRIADSALGQGSRLDTTTSLLSEKLKTFPPGMEPIDPFDDEAVAEYERQARKERMANKLPLNHRELYEEAVEHYRQGNIEETKQFLNKAIQLKEDFFEAWLLTASISIDEAMATEDPELREIEFSNASRCIDQAIAINPSSPEPYKLMARQFEFLDARDEMILALEKVNELEPSNWDYRKKLANVYLEKGINFHVYGDSAGAGIYLKKALDLYPYLADGWRWFGIHLLETGQLVKAIEAFERCLQLEPENAGAKEGLTEAHYRRAVQLKEEGDHDGALAEIYETFTLDHQHARAAHLQEEIMEDLCEIGFDLLDSGQGDEALPRFKKALEINEQYPFAWQGIAIYHFEKGEFDAGLDAMVKALRGWNVDVFEYSDEFVIDAILELFGRFRDPGIPRQERLADAAVELRTFMLEFVKLNAMVKDACLYSEDNYVKLFNFFMDSAKAVIEDGVENLGLVLESMGAGDLPDRLREVGDWAATRDTTDPDTRRARVEVLRCLDFFFNEVFNTFAFKCNSWDMRNIEAFINFMVDDYKISIDELYEIMEFVDAGPVLMKSFDIIATMKHIVKREFPTGELVARKMPAPVSVMVPHPTRAMRALVTQDRKLLLLDEHDAVVKSEMLASKAATRLKVEGFQWCPDGMKAIISENKTSGRLLRQGSDRIALVFFEHDPLFKPGADPSALEDELLELQVQLLSLGSNNIAIRWLDEEQFQALLVDGTLVTWTVEGYLLSRVEEHLLLASDTMITVSPDQRYLAMVQPTGEDSAFVSIIGNSSPDSRDLVELGIKREVISCCFDDASAALHLLARGNPAAGDDQEGRHVIMQVQLDGGTSEVAWIDDPGLNVKTFKATRAGEFFLYLVGDPETKLVVVDDADLVQLDLDIPAAVDNVFKEGVHEVNWSERAFLEFYMRKPFIQGARLDGILGSILDERASYLARFPKDSFRKRMELLQKLRDGISPR